MAGLSQCFDYVLCAVERDFMFAAATTKDNANA